MPTRSNRGSDWLFRNTLLTMSQLAFSSREASERLPALAHFARSPAIATSSEPRRNTPTQRVQHEIASNPDPVRATARNRACRVVRGLQSRLCVRGRLPHRRARPSHHVSMRVISSRRSRAGWSGDCAIRVTQTGNAPSASASRTSGPKASGSGPRNAKIVEEHLSVKSPRDVATGQTAGRRQHKP